MHPQNRLSKIAQDARSAFSQGEETRGRGEVALSAILSGFIPPHRFRHRENPSSAILEHPSRGGGGDSHAPPAFSTLLHII
jgi:hypothetical protein